MKITASSPEEYMEALPIERKEAVRKLRQAILENLPQGFQEQIQYNMIGYVVPLDLYPDGYHCKPGTPLPFMNLASQKNYIAVYSSAIYADPVLLTWFREEYAKRVTTKLDMGKSCIRFKKMDNIPYALIGELASKVSVEEWIAQYEKATKKK